MQRHFSQLKVFLESVIQASRHCCTCGGIQVREGVMCDRCRLECRAFVRGRDQPRVWLKGLPVYALFSWFPDLNPDLLGPWLHSLKGGGPKCEYEQMARQMAFSWQGHLNSGRFRQQVLIVPIPAKAGLTRDHATALGEALAKVTGWTLAADLLSLRVHPCLSHEQKFLSRRERQRVSFSCRAKFSKTRQPIVIVDDIVTTGATVGAAYEALGRPTKSQVWAQAYRCKKNIQLALKPTKGHP